MQYKKLLIANRGEISLRIQNTAKKLGLNTVAVFSEADAGALHASNADESVFIGDSLPALSYLNIEKIIKAALATGAEAIHPGYGFLSENAAFAEAVENEGLIWVGPPSKVIRSMGDKSAAKGIANSVNVPVLPTFETTSASFEYPIMIKALSGGGGRGMRLVSSEDEFQSLLIAAKKEAMNSFGDDRILLEKAVINPRHLEVQVLADNSGNIIHLGLRDCSIQRRHQKIIEETPPPNLDQNLNEAICAAGVAVAESCNYINAGTIEFLLDQNNQFWFLEMNTRLQVEHTVTEEVTGLDIVEWQLRIADGQDLQFHQSDIESEGHSIQVRLCAEDPDKDFMPQSGNVFSWEPPNNLRVDSFLETGCLIPDVYDSMMAKIISFGKTRSDAIRLLQNGLEKTVILGIVSNKELLLNILSDKKFFDGNCSTELLNNLLKKPVKGKKDSARERGAKIALLRAAASYDWGEWSGWSNAISAYNSATLVADGQQYPVVIEASEIRQRLDQLRKIPFVRRGEMLYLQLEHKSFSYRVILGSKKTSSEVSNIDTELVSQVNGRVLSVLVGIGDKVSKGDILMTVESMKMEYPLSVTHEAIVTKINVEEGNQVEVGSVLIELDLI